MSDFGKHVARRLEGSKRELCESWLEQLADLLPVEEKVIFPSDELLDHIPALISEIALYLEEPEENDFTMSSRVMAKARELGRLRHVQQASVHQLLREYDLLAILLEDFVRDMDSSRVASTDSGEAVSVTSLINRAVRLLMQITVDTFVSEYSQTIAEQQRRLEDFNRMVGHEVRGPMNTLQIVTSLLKGERGESADGRAALIALQERTLLHWDATLKSLESLSAIEGAEELSLTHQAVDLVAIFRDIALQLEDTAAASQVEIEVAPEGAEVSTDIGKLELAIVNLVANSIKYSDVDKSRRWVRIGSEMMPSGEVKIRVEDNGIGIDDVELPRIFDRFFRANPDSQVDGHGIGLAIVRECVRTLEGSISVDSKIGVGTTFEVTLPATAALSRAD